MSASTSTWFEEFLVPAEMIVLRQLVRMRLERKLSQAEVARRMKVTRQQVYNIERMRQGYPSIHTVVRYAKAVGARLVVLPR